MGVRLGRAAGLRRAARGRALAGGAALAVFVAAGLAALAPAVGSFGDRFATLPPERYKETSARTGGEAAAGDHLQLVWGFWLVGHQAGRGEPPWRDPYSFQPVAPERTVFQGWLLGLPYWPLEAAFGAVVAWNVLQVLGYVLAGAATAAWLRALGLGGGAALVGGLAFALAPYRVAQSTNHLLGLVAFLVPLSLWAVERGRGWLLLAAAALAAIPLSGQSHLALGAVPLVAGYALARRRPWWSALAVAVPALAAGVAVGRASVEDSVSEEGRSLRAIDAYSADWQDFLSRSLRHDPEQFVFLGWAVPLLALAGGVLAWRAGRRRLVAVLAAAVLVPALLALGTNTPVYELLYDAFPPLRYPRVPERLMPLAVLALAALVGLAADRARRPLLLALLAALVFVDLRAVENLYAAVPAGRSEAYAALADAPPGRLLELPVIEPQRHYGSVYLWYARQAPRERPQGYSTVAPEEALAAAEQLAPLACGRWNTPRARLLDELGVRYVALHHGVYVQSPQWPERCAAPAARQLLRHGFRVLARDGPIVLYARR